MPNVDYMPGPDGDFDQRFMDFNMELPALAARQQRAPFRACPGKFRRRKLIP